MTLDETKNVVAELQALDLSTYPTSNIDSLISRLKAFPMHATKFGIGQTMFRVRPGAKFSTVNDLSYKPQKYNTTYQRASTPKATMFYASIVPTANLTSELDNGRLIAVSEGSKIFRSKDLTEGQETVTFGMWRLQYDITLATILNPVIEKNGNPFAKERAGAFLEWLEGQAGISGQGKLILDFYADQFSKLVEWGEPDYRYLHSALLCSRLIQMGFDGILYPSARVENKGLNVAVSPNFVDAHMRLEGAMECIVAKRGDKIVCDNSRVAWLNAGQTEFNWTPIKSQAEVQANIEALLAE